MDRAGLTALLRASGCAVERSGAVFLCDPAWSERERAAASALMDRRAAGVEAGDDGLGWLGVRTGGSGGGVKFARHDEHTLGAAVRGFCAHFELSRVNAVNVLPWSHVSGLMAGVRCAMTGGRHVPWDWKRLERGELPSLDPAVGDDWVLSLVPTQLQRLLLQPATVAWLRAFRVIFLGGGPIWPGLAEAAAQARLPVSISYGLTETAAMVAALSPAEFLAGERSCGRALPHANLSVTADGLVRVAGESVFRGYWPDWSAARVVTTEDRGTIDAAGRVHLHGRRDALIISGGKKIAPAEVEAALRASGEFDDVAVIGVPDAEWGEIVVACYPAGSPRAPDPVRAVAGLAAHQRPKRFVPVVNWPRNAQGKINRAMLAEQLSAR
ncbi:AMP-binding protein [Horticoccus sp. 23ND18S-11]|uniref:AMP-binding protein n=1 Tax=Horticoccus sp. 23ND18S-11 TaxID=3391832 RepID=UPI0039C90E46